MSKINQQSNNKNSKTYQTIAIIPSFMKSFMKNKIFSSYYDNKHCCVLYKIKTCSYIDFNKIWNSYTC